MKSKVFSADEIQAYLKSISLEGEIYKPLKIKADVICKGYYISNYGNCFSFCRHNPRKIKLYYHKDGYIYLRIKSDLRRRNRLVALSFIDNPNNLPVVNHINHDKHCDKVSNLEWVSYSDNTKKYFEFVAKQNKQEAADRRLSANLPTT